MVKNKKWLQGRQSTNIEDRRVPRDINRPVTEGYTDPPRDETTRDLNRTRVDRMVAEMARMEPFRPKRRSFSRR